jgi:hypothetical protein
MKNIDKKKVDDLISMAKISATSSLTAFFNEFSSLKDLIKDHQNTNDWYFYMTIGGIASGISLIHPKLSKKDFNEFTKWIDESLSKWDIDGTSALLDLSKFVKKTVSENITPPNAIGLWVVWNIKKEQPDKDETSLVIDIGQYLSRGFEGWWNV